MFEHSVWNTLGKKYEKHTGGRSVCINKSWHMLLQPFNDLHGILVSLFFWTRGMCKAIKHPYIIFNASNKNNPRPMSLFQIKKAFYVVMTSCQVKMSAINCFLSPQDVKKKGFSCSYQLSSLPVNDCAPKTRSVNYQMSTVFWRFLMLTNKSTQICPSFAKVAKLPNADSLQ